MSKKIEFLIWIDGVGYSIERILDKLSFQQYRKKPVIIRAIYMTEDFEIETLEGRMKGKAGDVLILGVANEPYPCKPEIFKATYEAVQ